MTERQPLIVVADDNQDILDLVRMRLERRGYDIVTAGAGQEALDLIRERHPAAAVLDWMMPDLTGPAVCAELKASPETADIPVVMLTARAAEGDVAGGFEAGADDYLTKPFDLAELDQTLRRLINDAP